MKLADWTVPSPQEQAALTLAMCQKMGYTFEESKAEMYGWPS